MSSPATRGALTHDTPTVRQGNGALALSAICLGFLMITLDATIVNVALGPILSDLGGGLAGAQWVVSGYTLAFASLLLTAGALADRIGARRGFVIGLVVFAAGSTVCTVALSLPMLIASRVLQGAGAAWLMPCSLALIGHTFTESSRRRRALAMWGGASGIGLAAGPVLGGVLTSAVSWRAIFVVNLPVAAITGLLLVRQVAETPVDRRPLDLPGQLLAIATLSMLAGGFIVAGERGWSNVLSVMLLAAGAIAAVTFTAVERAVAQPMVDPALFHARPFRIAVAIGLIFNFCLYGSLFCLAIYLNRTHALDTLQTGLGMLPVTVVTGAMAYLSGHAIKRVGEWPVMLAGLACGVGAAVLVALAAESTRARPVIASSALLGLTGMVMPAMSAVAIGSASHRRIGLASGVLNAARQIGGVFGVAVLGALLGAGHDGVSLEIAFTVVAGAYAAGIALAACGRRSRRAQDQHARC
jgi:DHA2 family methylenomycin A resistance protein-like MFS transporter